MSNQILTDIQTSLDFTALTNFQLFQLQTMLDIAVPQVNVDISGSVNLSTNKAFFLFKERNNLNFPTLISPKTIKTLEYHILHQDILDISNFNLLTFFRSKSSLLQLDSYVASIIAILHYFKFTSKEVITILLSTLDYQSRGFSELITYKRGVRVPNTIYHQTYQPKGLIKLYGLDEYIKYTQLSNYLINLQEEPYSLTRLVIAFYYSCLYFKHHNLDKYSQDLNFRSVVKHFDCTYNSWEPRYLNWIQTQYLLTH